MDDYQHLRPLLPGEKIKTTKGPNKGAYSTERVRTVQAADGSWMNVNSLWMGRDGTVTDLAHWSDDQLAEFAQGYERKAGVRYDRFTDLTAAETAAQKRSHAGGAGSGKPLARKIGELKPAKP